MVLHFIVSVIRGTGTYRYRYRSGKVTTFGGDLISCQTTKLYGMFGATFYDSLGVILGQRRDIKAGDGVHRLYVPFYFFFYNGGLELFNRVSFPRIIFVGLIDLITSVGICHVVYLTLTGTIGGQGIGRFFISTGPRVVNLVTYGTYTIGS